MSQRQLDTGVNYFKCILLVTLLIAGMVEWCLVAEMLSASARSNKSFPDTCHSDVLPVCVLGSRKVVVGRTWQGDEVRA